MSKLVKVRYLTTARGPHYRHDEGQEDELELTHARQLVEDGIVQAVDPADLVEEVEPEVTDQKKSEPQKLVPETAELRPAEKAVAPPQERVGPRRRPADHEVERPTQKG